MVVVLGERAQSALLLHRIEATVTHRGEEVRLERGGDGRAFAVLPQSVEEILHQLFRRSTIPHILPRERTQRPIVLPEHELEGSVVPCGDACEVQGREDGRAS